MVYPELIINFPDIYQPTLILMKTIFIILSSLLICSSIRAEVRLPDIFTGNMVIQRDKPLQIWGWADPGERVKVIFNGQRVSTKAGKEGSWKVQLKPMPANANPQNLMVESKHNDVILKNVMIGDVWICSGQSNMVWPLRRLKAGEEESGEANYPALRMFTVSTEMALVPQDDLDGTGWKVAKGEVVMDFSAVAYYFGKHLLAEEGVPIGLVITAWGGTNIEAWTSMETLGKYDHIKKIYDGLDKAYDQNNTREEKSPARRLKMITAAVHKGDGLRLGWESVNTSTGDWDTITLPQARDNELFRDYDGAVWFRRSFDVPLPFRGKDLRFNMGNLYDHDMVWINGYLIGETYESKTARRYDISSDLLKPEGNEIVVRIFDYGNEGGFITDPYSMNFHPVEDSKGYQLLCGMWKHKKSYTLETSLNLPLDRPRSMANNSPSSLYNQMIHPLLNLSIKGAIWYQGEANASRANEYTSLFSDMILDWRKQWDQGDFPFLFVQLAAYDRPSEPTWPELREAQRKALELPNTGMAVTIDIGHPTNIHPENKWDVGKRLALAARKVAYGKDITFSGPILETAEPAGNKMRLTFSQVGNGLKVIGDYDYLMGFEVSADNEHFEFAKAEIIDEKTVIVWTDKVKQPAHVRYAWKNYPSEANLYNSADLPASPFRTGDWNWITEGKLYGN
jgi:sialate O-acetylesterase